MTRNDAIEEATTQYVSGLTPGSLPDPKTAQDDLLEMTQNYIEMGNAVIASKDRKWEMPKKLTPRQIAELMLALDHIVKISFTDTTSGSGYDMLGIYITEGPRKGIYSTVEDDLFERAAMYDYNISTKELAEVQGILSRKAKKVHVCDDINLVAVGNGIFDFNTKTLSDFTPDICFLSKSQVDYVAGATSPVIPNPDDGTVWEVEEWMKSLSDDEGVPELLWEVVGAVVRPNVPWNKAAWFYSEQGNNGKGTLCELMRNLCGGSAVTLAVADMGKDFMLEQIIGKSAIITDENDVGVYIDKAANLKAIITGDAVMINRKHQKAVTYRFRGFMVQCLNELPKIRDRSDSIYRRQLFIPFRKWFGDCERKYIKEDYLQRKEVLEYVLCRVLNMDYYELSCPDACKELLSEYKVFNDPVKQFADDVFPRLAWDGIPWGFLYDLYLAWMKKNIPGSSVLGKHAFTLNIMQEAKSWPEWYCPDRNKPNRTGSKMDKYEPLIEEYDLKDWQDPLYKGLDKTKKFRPATLPGSFKGMVRMHIGANGTFSNDSDDDIQND